MGLATWPRIDATPSFYWAVPRQAGKAGLLGGEYPGSSVVKATRERLAVLVETVGVRAFLDLTCHGELTPYLDKLPLEVEHHRIAVPDWHAPTVEQTVEALDWIDRQLRAGRTVYVHCWGGVGRTGTVIGCWLVRHGLTGQEALDRVQQLFQGTRKGHRHEHSPEFPAQVARVLDWQGDA